MSEQAAKHAKTSESVVALVTGASGLVGRAIQKVVAEEDRKDEKWIFLASKDADLRDLEQTRALFEKYKPTHVIHLAAFVGGLYKNMAKPVEFLNYNLAMNQNITQMCFEYKVSLFFLKQTQIISVLGSEVGLLSLDLHFP